MADLAGSIRAQFNRTVRHARTRAMNRSRERPNPAVAAGAGRSGVEAKPLTTTSKRNYAQG
jgi:hypothetical protein